MSEYIDSVKSVSWSSLQRQKPLYNIESAIEGWLKSKAPVTPHSPQIWHWINAAMSYVLSKILGAAIGAFQAAMIGAFTVADFIAWCLRTGIEFKNSASQWVKLLMRKIMQALNMKVIEKEEQLTRQFMQKVLVHLTEKAHREAEKAIRNEQ